MVKSTLKIIDGDVHQLDNIKLHANDSLIDTYQLRKIELNKLKKLVKIDPNYLKEKDTWYEIANKLQYFKVRGDYRLFSELFCTYLGNLLGLNMVDYHPAYITDIDPCSKNGKEKKKLGLLSPNFQIDGNHYYLASDLYKPEICAINQYGPFSLKYMLAYFKQKIETSDNYAEVEQDLVNLFIFDYFTHQLDRNPNNIGFQMQMTTTKESYKEPLHGKGKIEIHVSKIFDSERSLGAIHRGGLTYNLGEDWQTLFPYDPFYNEEIDDLDPNLVTMFFDMCDQAIPLLERLAFDDEYRKVFENFRSNTSQIGIDKNIECYLTNLFKYKQEQIKKVLSLAK